MVVFVGKSGGRIVVGATEQFAHGPGPVPAPDPTELEGACAWALPGGLG